MMMHADQHNLQPIFYGDENMKVCLYSGILLAILIGWNGGLGAAASETSDSGREVFETFKDAVVTVRTVIGMSFGGSESESEQEANATLIAPDGLAVLALSAVDPTQMVQGLRMSDEEMTTRIVSMRVILPDGNEKPAEIVLRDQDLDLVFIRLTEAPEAPLPCVNLERIGHPGMLDEVVCVMQYGQVARRARAAFIDRIETIVEKPRLFYALGDHRARQVVCSPVFTLAGEFVGVGVMRVMSGAAKPSSDNIMVIIVPGDQIRDLMAQVPPLKQ